ncbi:MAG TPA: hypothetical protein VFY40_28515, partial [Blastocatellia bacterium]|nr:hypothetical protein [Blastocatellia bacterium]
MLKKLDYARKKMLSGQTIEKASNETMLLEAKAENCFSSKFVLKADGRTVGKFHGRWFGEDLEIDLTERRHLQFRKLSWLGSKFELVDPLNNR